MILNKDTEKNVQSFIKEWDKKSGYFLPNKTYSKKDKSEIWQKFYKDLKFPLEHTVIYNYNSFCDRLDDKSVADFTPLKRFVCRKLVNGCYVLTDGKITICEQDIEGEYSFAEAEFDIIKDFIYNEKYQKYIQNQKNGIFNDPELCEKCDQYYIPVY